MPSNLPNSPIYIYFFLLLVPGMKLKRAQVNWFSVCARHYIHLSPKDFSNGGCFQIKLWIILCERHYKMALWLCILCVKGDSSRGQHSRIIGCAKDNSSVRNAPTRLLRTGREEGGDPAPKYVCKILDTLCHINGCFQTWNENRNWRGAQIPVAQSIWREFLNSFWQTRARPLPSHSIFKRS